MKQTISLLLIFLITSGVVSASDSADDQSTLQLQLDVPVQQNWLWVSPDKPRITINITNASAADAMVTARLLINTDKMQPYMTLDKQEAVRAGQTTSVMFDLDAEPGFYQCTATVNDELARSFVFGVDPQDIASPPDYQPDFHGFWSSTKSELAQVDGHYTLTEIPQKSTAKRKVYLLEMHSLPDMTGEVIARAYYAEPVAEGTYPAIVHFNGYDSGDDEPWCMGGDDNPDCVQIAVSTRGQQINNRPPYVNPYGDYFVSGFDSEYNYYYRGAYMDCVRAIDFLCSRPKVQQHNIFAVGGSQGGAFALAAAALADDRLNAIAVAIPFMSDFPDNFQIASWPGGAAIAKKNELSMSDDEMYRMLSYFDIKNLATMVTCPTYMNFSLQDNICPPHTNWAAYNNLGSTDKQYSVNPTQGHQGSPDWRSEYMAFFEAHMREPGSVDEVQTDSNPNKAIYNMQGIRVGEAWDTLPKGIYVRNGEKIAKF